MFGRELVDRLRAVTDFGVRTLPEQHVPRFQGAAHKEQQVRIGDARGVEPGVEFVVGERPSGVRRQKPAGRADDLVPAAIALKPEQGPALRRGRGPTGRWPGKVVRPSAQSQRGAKVRGRDGERTGAGGTGAPGDRCGCGSEQGVEPGVEPGERLQPGNEGERLGRDPGGPGAGREDRGGESFGPIGRCADNHGEVTQIVSAHGQNTTRRKADVNDLETCGRRLVGLTIAGHRRKMSTKEDDAMNRTLTLTVALAAGCLLFLAPAPARSEATSTEHTIRSGDNLHLIAGYYYGNPREWKRIWKANRKALAGPSRLTPGKTLRIEGTADDSLLGSYDEFRSRVRGK